jgi:hypothetical protein
MSNKLNDEKIKEAKAKLACHIEPPKGSPYAEMLAQSGLTSDASSEPAAVSSETPSAASCGTASGASCGTAAPAQGGKIRLTEMTSAGG